MSQRRYLTDSEAWRIVGWLEGGQTQAEVAEASGVAQSVWKEIGSVGRRPEKGRRRATTPNEDLEISIHWCWNFPSVLTGNLLTF
ncbi:hypothetical protein NPIL_18311 [Nephila pilipes]|uniref:Uncharacterized protein n=1 Tax=Nephila pilipes TaxID=299642 RepID=A0A8X6MVM6_NEPPI|nr:hypothetical protein NPIL_18311 [Nephila pilipes]